MLKLMAHSADEWVPPQFGDGLGGLAPRIDGDPGHDAGDAGIFLREPFDPLDLRKPRCTAFDENNLFRKAPRCLFPEDIRNMRVRDRRHLMQPGVGVEDRWVPKVHMRINEGHERRGCR